MGTGRVLLGILAGASVGAVLGILFAPDKGSVTRRKIAQKSREYSETIAEGFHKSMEGVDKGFHSLRDTLAGYAGFARHKADDLTSSHN